jgi:hypothetical protein
MPSRTSSAAAAMMVTVPETVGPSIGLAIARVGAVTSRAGVVAAAVFE